MNGFVPTQMLPYSLFKHFHLWVKHFLVLSADRPPHLSVLLVSQHENMLECVSYWQWGEDSKHCDWLLESGTDAGDTVQHATSVDDVTSNTVATEPATVSAGTEFASWLGW